MFFLKALLRTTLEALASATVKNDVVSSVKSFPDGTKLPGRSLTWA